MEQFSEYLRLIPATQKDWLFILELRNKYRKLFFTTKKITWKEHTKFMHANSDCYFICTYRSQSAGFIGVIDNDIRLCVSEHYQKHGIGTYMLKKIKKLFPGATGKIRTDNKASLRAFKKAGIYAERIDD